jgi:SAM-dependent methyltransferase
MDDVTQYNIARWAALAKAGALFTRPWLQLDPDTARQGVDPEGIFGDVTNKKVLCLASGGGQQSAAFALLGAHVTVFDLSEAQLARDQEAARRYQVEIKTIQGDMRDLSLLDQAAFDIVWHPYSLNFVPDAREVFRQVARVVRPDGLYYLMCANPFVTGLASKDWDGQGYPLKLPYLDGAEVSYEDEAWVFREGADPQPIQGPKEHRQTLSRLINGLVEQGFIIFQLKEWTEPAPGAEPGSWDHFQAIAPPWLSFWTTYRPDIFKPGTAAS